jgi:hypothetical protein
MDRVELRATLNRKNQHGTYDGLYNTAPYAHNMFCLHQPPRTLNVAAEYYTR